MAVSDLKRFIAPGALVIGGVTAGSMLAPVALAAADDDQELPADAGESDHRHRHPGRHLAADVLTDTLGMTADELRAAFADGKSLADIAADQGVAIDDLKTALTTAATDRLDEAVANDRIDADRAAELAEGLDARIDEMINRTRGDGRGHGPGFGHGHRSGDGFDRGDRGDRGDRAAARAERAEALADLLGLTTDDLRAARADGQTLAELAEAQGVAEDDLVAFLLEGVEERLDQAVESGRIDAEDVDEKLARASERISERINAEPGERFESKDGHGRRGGHHRGDTEESSLDL